MITPRRSDQRRHTREPALERWATFAGDDRADLLAAAFAPLVRLDELVLEPGASLARGTRDDIEAITLVLAGVVTCADATGGAEVVTAGEVHRGALGRGSDLRATNPSVADAAHALQVWLRTAAPSPASGGPPGDRLPGPGPARRRFSAADRRGRWCLIAARDGGRGALPLGQDARVFAALATDGQHLVHALGPGHLAWLHVLSGEARVGGHTLGRGDGAGAIGERALSVTAGGAAELVLVVLGA